MPGPVWGCGFITFFNASGSPLAHGYRSFKFCDSVVPCANCVSQNMACFETCGSNFFGKMDDNVIDVVNGIKSETECKLLCSDTDVCQWYTHFTEDDPLKRDLCFLLTEMSPPLESKRAGALPAPAPDTVRTHKQQQQEQQHPHAA